MSLRQKTSNLLALDKQIIALRGELEKTRHDLGYYNFLRHDRNPDTRADALKKAQSCVKRIMQLQSDLNVIYQSPQYLEHFAKPRKPAAFNPRTREDAFYMFDTAVMDLRK